MQVQPLLEVFDTELPFNRVPMHDKVQELAAGRLATDMPGSLLNDHLLSELHPASWCVGIVHASITSVTVLALPKFAY